jgi:hypothetical protein
MHESAWDMVYAIEVKVLKWIGTLNKDSWLRLYI